MLIKFGVENHRSIAARQELSLVAASLKDASAALISLPKSQIELLPAALIYGANASGKSNFISAMAYLQQSVKFSHQTGSPTGGIARTPFIFDPRFQSEPSKFDIDFALEGVRYQYGFSANDERYLDEWLFAFPAGKRQTWFVRDPAREHIYFGKNLKGSTRTIEALMRKNSLFLSVATQNAHDQLVPIFRFLVDISLNIDFDSRATFMEFREGQCDDRIIKFLKNADTGIVAHRFEELPNELNKIVSATVSAIGDVVRKHISDTVKFPPDHGSERLRKIDDLVEANLFAIKRIALGHAGPGGRTVFFDLDNESSGTLRLLSLLKSVFSALDRGTVVVIDELDASLHTYLAEDIISLFNDKKTNPNGAQLIATTHDTNLLGGKLMRRDQIWFTEKDNNGATALYPLTDIRTRNTDNIEKGYLEGRFGAVPFRGSIRALVGTEE